MTGTVWLQFLMALVGGVGVLAAAWWFFSRRMSQHHEASLALYSLSERVISAETPSEIAGELADGLPDVVQATSAQLYLFNRRTRCLELIATPGGLAPLAAPIEHPPDGMVRAAVMCLRNKTVVSVPDVRRNPLIQVTTLEGLPRSAMFVPLLSRNEAVGVLELDNAARVGYFSREDQEAAQHVANMAAASLRLQQQQNMREQLFRGEKLVATGYLISGVANELREPIDDIARLTEALTVRNDAGELSAAVQRASEIMARLVSFANSESATPKEVDVAALLGSLAKFREPHWQEKEIRVKHRAASGPAMVLGVASQLEQVFLTLLVHAEHRAVQSPIRTVTLQTSVLAGRVLIEIGYSEGADPEDILQVMQQPEPEGLDLEVCTGIIRNHGGEIHVHKQPGLYGFEVDLPLAKSAVPEREPANAGVPAVPVRPLTLILVDPDRAAVHHLMSILSRRGHRVVPARAEEAADLVQRVRFDAVLWAAGPGRGEWTQFRDRVRAAVASFVLISDGYDRQLAESMEQNGSYLLARPVEEPALDRVLGEIAHRGVHAE